VTDPKNSVSTATVAAWALALTVGVWVGSLLWAELPERGHANDFAHYYVTSRVWIEGRDPYQVSFSREFARFGFVYDDQIWSAGNAPPLIAAFVPFAVLPPHAAFVAWVSLEGCLLFATFGMIYLLIGSRLPAPAVPLLALALGASRATFSHFFYSQVQLLVGFLLLLGYLLQRRRHCGLAWLCVAMAASLKLFPALLLPWFIVSARGSTWRKALWLTPICLFAMGLWYFTRDLWPGFINAGVAVITANVPNRVFDYSLPSFVVKLGWSWHWQHPSAHEAAQIWRMASVAGASVALLAYGICWHRRLDAENAFCLLLLSSVLASPTAWGHYFVLAFFPFAVFLSAQVQVLSIPRLLSVAVVYLFVLFLANFGAWAPAGTARILAEYTPMYACLGLMGWFAWRPQATQVVRSAR
jgi:hypothetical protein